jgi:flagellar hook-length control protein FliK
MTDATVQMLVSQLGNANIKNTSKKELMEAAAGLPDFGNILSNAGKKDDMSTLKEDWGASKSLRKKDVANRDTSVSDDLNYLRQMIKRSGKSSEPTPVKSDEKVTSLSEKLGFGDGETDVEDLADALCYLTSQMMQVLTENLGVTEEQVQNCLEQNNLLMTDLLDPTKFAEVFVQLSGKEIDAVDVVNDEGFTKILEAFNEEIKAIFTDEEGNEVKVDTKDLMNKAHILVDYGVIDAKMTTIYTGEQVLSDEDNVSELLQDNTKSDNDSNHYHLSDNMDIPYNSGEAVNNTEAASDINNAGVINASVVAEAEESDKASDKTDKNSELSSDGDPNKKLVFTTGGEATKAEWRDLEPRPYDDLEDLRRIFKRNRHATGDNTDEITDLIKNLNNKGDLTPTQDIPEVPLSDMVNKVQEYIEILAKNDKITSLQMQLNPENLGKVTVEVATKDGYVSAKVVVESQAAKDALAANLANLRTNLEQQGLKIADIEVTVASHAFEQNLQQDGSREQEQLAKEMQQETQKNLRTINLREVGLNELRGLMSEEDIVVAKMMADNGEILNIKA